MADFRQTISDSLCSINKEIKDLRKITAENFGVASGIKELNISIPETGGSTKLYLGENTINFYSGTLKKSNGEVVQLEDSLSKSGRQEMHSFAISSDKQIRYRLKGHKQRIMNSNHTDHMNNIDFKEVEVLCDQTTNIQLRASTNPNPNMGQVVNYKIDDDGKQHVLIEGDVGQVAQNTDNSVYTTPLGDQGTPFAQCPHDRILNVDAYQWILENPAATRDSVIGYDTAIATANFEILANANFSQPAADIQMEVVSNNVADDSVGAGAQVVRITYFNIAWEKKTTDVIMDGTTIVNTTATDIYRIESFMVIKGQPAVGTITIKDTGGTILYGQMQPLTTFMERAIHYIATGERCVLTDFIISTQTKEGIIFRVFSSKVYGTDIVTTGRFSATLQEGTMVHAFNIPLVVENPDGLRLAVGLAVRGLAAAQGGSGSFKYYCEDI